MCRSLSEIPGEQRQEANGTADEVHSLLQDQAEASAQNCDNRSTPISISVYGSNDGIESALLSQLQNTARSPHLYGEGADAFGLRDVYGSAAAASGLSSLTMEKGDSNADLIKARSSSDLPLFSSCRQSYGSPFQRDTFDGAQFNPAETTGDTLNSRRNQNTLFPLTSVEQNSTHTPTTQPSSHPAVTMNYERPKPAATISSDAQSSEPFAGYTTADFTIAKPFIPRYSFDDAGQEAGHHHQQLSSPRDSGFDKNLSHTGPQAPSAGETKPIGFVPAVRGKTLQQERLEAAAEAEISGQPAHYTAGTSRPLTTTARVQPSSVPPQTQATISNVKTETTDSETGDECKAVDTQPLPPPPIVPGYPAPWPIPPPPYPGAGAPFPYPFYAPWPYCQPVPMMTMMPHPMSMVPVPCWMPAMHPAMRMQTPVVPSSTADAGDKSETKPANQ